MTLGISVVPAGAQSWRPPSDDQRCPSKRGAGDQRGSGNHAKPENVLRAARLIKTGEVIELAHVLSPDMPLSSTRASCGMVVEDANSGDRSTRTWESTSADATS